MFTARLFEHVGSGKTCNSNLTGGAASLTPVTV